MTNIKFDLLDIFKEIIRRKKFVILFTLASIIVGLIFCFVQKKQYTSESIFIVKSPQIMDRSRTYHDNNYDPTVFFATNDDVDHIVTIAKSNDLAEYIVNKYHLIDKYGFKTKDDAVKKFKKNMKFVRGDTKNIELYFTYPDPDTAFAITKDITNRIEDVFRNYFYTINSDMVKMLEDKQAQINDTIAIINDSIDNIRKEYNLYNTLLPSRGEIINTNNIGISDPVKAAGMEKLQKIVYTKDAYLKSNSEFVSLIEEYKTTLKDDDIKFLYRIQDAYRPDTPSFPNIPITLLICFVGGLLFACLLVVIIAFYKKIDY